MGWWGPIAAKAGVCPLGHRPIFRGLGIALLGAVTVAAATIALSSLYVARWGVAASGALVALVAGVAFRTTYGRFMRTIHAEED
jgi:hypothetical protein